MSDLISRQGVSAWLSNMGHEKLADMVMDERRFPPRLTEYKTFCGVPMEEAVRIVQEYNADKPKTGTWSVKFDGDGWNDHWTYTCSECGQSYTDLYPKNYCPNCGSYNGGEKSE